MMKREILINVEFQETRVAILNKGVLEEFYIERADETRLVGNIYKGRIKTILLGIAGAFVDIGINKNGFLLTSEKISPLVLEDEPHVLETEIFIPSKKPQIKTKVVDSLKPGQELTVQVVKEPYGIKGPRLTTNITLPGRYLVLMPRQMHFGISRRIENEQERTRLKKVLESLSIPTGMGLIVRTAGSGKERKEFQRDLNYLLNLWKRINRLAGFKSAPFLLHQEYDIILRNIRDTFTEDVDKLFIDSKEQFKRILHFVNILCPHLKRNISYYTGDEDLFEKFNIDTEIEKLYRTRVGLRSGGYIVIEQTEGLVAIDVNSGKFVGKKSLEDTVFNVNMEAANEIARQIKLRDLGGIIIIDFIDMEKESHRNRVYQTFLEALKLDKARSNVLPVSEIGLIQMTRQRTRRSIESKMYDSCSYCKGRGSIKSALTMSILAIRNLKKMLKDLHRRSNVSIYVHPDVAWKLLNEQRSAISYLEDRYKSKIIINEDPKKHIEDIEIKVA
ncbi:MAG: Rne/Rng family ribonuclease [Candidatus Omnitrophica bacterium]|nr:Rne/Rng family ribonuclease [Candidatus Omnitrophota bacterium]